MNSQPETMPRVFFRQWVTREQLEQMYACPHTEQDPSETWEERVEAIGTELGYAPRNYQYDRPQDLLGPFEQPQGTEKQ